MNCNSRIVYQNSVLEHQQGYHLYSC